MWSILISLFISITCNNKQATLSRNYLHLPDTLTCVDSARMRSIPVALYSPWNYSHNYTIDGHYPLVLVSHGYGANQPGSYLSYTFLSEALATKGYFVISIQHELTKDSLLPTAGIPQIVRRPAWERGADNIHFILQWAHKKYACIASQPVILIGHSNGGDMSSLYPQKYPGNIHSIITLDHRRMALPLIKGLHILTLRSDDQQPDAGVIPDETTCALFGITVQPVPVHHNNMSDNGTLAERDTILHHVLQFLRP